MPGPIAHLGALNLVHESVIADHRQVAGTLATAGATTEQQAATKAKRA